MGCDNGKEYLNNRVYKFARDKGIVLNNCPTYVHELNGAAQRYKGRVMDMARYLLAEAQAHKEYWPKMYSIILEKSYISKHSREKDSIRNIF